MCLQTYNIPNIYRVYIFKELTRGFVYVSNKEIMLIIVLLTSLQYIPLYSRLSLF